MKQKYCKNYSSVVAFFARLKQKLFRPCPDVNSPQNQTLLSLPLCLKTLIRLSAVFVSYLINPIVSMTESSILLS